MPVCPSLCTKSYLSEVSYGLPNAFWKKVTLSIALRTELVVPGTSSQAHDLPCFPGRCPLQASTPKDWALPSDHVLLPSPLISQHRHSFLDHIHLGLNLSRSQDRKCGRDEILVSALRPIESGLCMVSSTTRSQNFPWRWVWRVSFPLKCLSCCNARSMQKTMI